MSFWTMGFNQHTRGVWCNNMVYNLHLLTGKISTPGNSPFSLTGQPSACGTAREVGTFSHRLPADMVVTNPEAPRDGRGDLEAAGGHDPGQARLPRRAAEPHAQGRQAQRLLGAWSTTTCRPAPNLMQEGYPGYRNPDNFIVVSDAYPTVTALAADLILPAAMWVEKEGAYGNAERRTHFWHQLVDAPGRGALGPVAAHGVLQALQDRGGVAGGAARRRSPSTAARRCTTCCSATAQVDKFPLVADRGRLRRTHEAKAFGFYVQKGLFEEYAQFGRGHGHDLAPFDTYHQVRGLRWPVVNGKETLWRYREGADPYVKAGTGFQFYGYPDGKALIYRAALRAGRRRRPTRTTRSGCRPAACSSTGTRAR